MATLLVAGLTASGKTSATTLAAQRLGYQWISGSDLRRQFYTLNDADAEGSRLDQALSASNLNLEEKRLRTDAGEQGFDAELLRLSTAVTDAVFDVWFLPWLVGDDHPAITALLRAAPQTRAERVARMTGRSVAQAAGVLSDKDERSRRYALKQYNIDIDRDHSRFNVVLDTDALTIDEVVDRLCQTVRAG
jgi:cytidylate kinase